MKNDTDNDLSPQEKRIWFAVFVTECIVILIINAFTLITFARNRHLRKRSTYLIINLTVADLLVGTVAIPLFVFASDIVERNKKAGEGFSWQAFIFWGFNLLFIVASLVNILLISLERLHATLFPFRHCLTGKWIYFKIIICSWFIAFLMSFLLGFFSLYAPVALTYAFASCIFLTLLILTVSYVIIISNVKSNPHPLNFGSKLSAERKLTATLFIVTVISYLTILPFGIYIAIPRDIQSTLPSEKNFRLFKFACHVLYCANSIVNPLIYAIRMEEFRKAAKELVCKGTPESIRVQPIDLPTMQCMPKAMEIEMKLIHLAAS